MTSEPTNPAPIRVLVADDEPLIRRGLIALLGSTSDLRVVGEAGTGAQAVREARALAADVVLMDLRMPVMDGLEATRHLVAAATTTPRVLVVTTFDDDELVFAALRAGASGFVLKDTPPDQLLDAVRVVHRGEALLSPTITRRLIGAFVDRDVPRPSSPDHRLDDLTEREREVFAEVANGRSNAEIAAALFVSLPTVKTHVGRLLAKLDCRDRAQLVVFAYENGVVRPGR